jgi:hypothetical protein
MVQALAGFSAILLTSVGWGIGGRLLLLARRTRQLPELMLGLGVFCIGGLGYPLAFATTALIEAGSALAPYGLIASATACHLGLLAHSVFTWKVFRPQTAWARAAVIAVAAAALVGFVGNASVGFGDPAEAEAGSARFALFMMAVSALTFAWSASESLAYHARLRRQLALGIANPVVVNRFLLWVNRFLLWGVSSAASVIGTVVNAWFVWSSPLSVLHPAALLASAVCGGAGAVVMLLTFVPPARYVRFIESRHAARAA